MSYAFYSHNHENEMNERVMLIKAFIASKRFQILDFLSGGRLSTALREVYHLLGRASVNHGLMENPECDIRRHRTKEELYAAVDKNINSAKRCIIEIYQL